MGSLTNPLAAMRTMVVKRENCMMKEVLMKPLGCRENEFGV